jgi:hypothetical protein
MSETCPKCGSNKTNFEGQCSWDCGTYQPLIGGSRIRNPQSKLIVGAHCKDRQTLAKMSFAAGELKAELAAEQALREAAEARAAGLREALRQCIIELSYLVDQTDSFVGGSTCRALDAGKSALLAAAEG